MSKKKHAETEAEVDETAISAEDLEGAVMADAPEPVDAGAAFLALAAATPGASALFVPADIYVALEDWQISRALASVGMRLAGIEEGDEGARLILAALPED